MLFPISVSAHISLSNLCLLTTHILRGHTPHTLYYKSESLFFFSCLFSLYTDASLSGQNFYMLEDTIVCEADFLVSYSILHVSKYSYNL